MTMHSDNPRKAYITICTDDKYLPGVVALNRSLRTVESEYPLIVLTTGNMSESGVQTLANESIRHLTAKNIVPSEYIRNLNIKNGSPNWSNTFFKLRIFGLSQFDTLVYLDSDMIVLRNIDHLFDKLHMSAVAAGHHFNKTWNQLNSGLMVFTPSIALEKNLVDLIEGEPSADMLNGQGIGDQDIINHYFDDWDRQDNLHLPETYNQFISLVPEYLRKGYLATTKDIYVVHFVGKVKPWNYTIKEYLHMLLRALRWRSLAEFSIVLTFNRLLRK